MLNKFWSSLTSVLSVFFDEIKVHQTMFLNACKSDNDELVNVLLEFSDIDPSVDDNYAIRMASIYGHVAVVDRLLQDGGVDPSNYKNYAIRLASGKGHIAVVNRLLQD